jgi:DNA polymerase III alpha subunit
MQYGNTIESLPEMSAGQTISLIAIVCGIKEISTKKNKETMAFLTLEDLTGTVEATCFPKIYAKHHEAINSLRPLKVDALVDVTETDQDRIVKLIVKGVTPVIVQETEKIEKIEVTIPLERVEEYLVIQKEYAGDSKDVAVILKAGDGTLFKLSTQRINHKSREFLDKVSRL